MDSGFKRLDGRIDSLKGEVLSDIRRLDEKIDSGLKRLDGKIDSLKGEILSEIRRLDTRIDSLEKELKTAIELRERLAALEAKLP
jgi:archaellum component FlaC